VNAQVTGAAGYSGRVARSANDGLSNEGMTALHAAVQAGNANLVRYLLDHGANANIVDASGRTPMDVLNGVPALRLITTAEGAGLAPAGTNAVGVNLAGGGGRGGARGGAGGSQEIRTMLLAAASIPPK
jgi:ankyrin repeat protein